MQENYPKAYKEVLEILKYVPNEKVDKIPEKLICTFEHKKDSEHVFYYDKTKNLDEQKLLSETKAILANIYTDYWATPSQKEMIMAKQKKEREEIEKEKRTRYNPDELFKKKQIHKENMQKDNKSLIIVERKNFLVKLINFIKKISQK